MKKTFLIGLFCFFAFISFSQKMYTVKYESQANVKVYVVKYESQADLNVYKVNYESQAGDNNGKWFFVDYESQAGWKNSSKKHLLY